MKKCKSIKRKPKGLALGGVVSAGIGIASSIVGIGERQRQQQEELRLKEQEIARIEEANQKNKFISDAQNYDAYSQSYGTNSYYKDGGKIKQAKGNNIKLDRDTKSRRIGSGIEVTTNRKGTDKINANIAGTNVRLDDEEIIVKDQQGNPVVISDDNGEADRYRNEVGGGNNPDNIARRYANRAKAIQRFRDRGKSRSAGIGLVNGGMFVRPEGLVGGGVPSARRINRISNRIDKLWDRYLANQNPSKGERLANRYNKLFNKRVDLLYGGSNSQSDNTNKPKMISGTSEPFTFDSNIESNSKKSKVISGTSEPFEFKQQNNAVVNGNSMLNTFEAPYKPKSMVSSQLLDNKLLESKPLDTKKIITPLDTTINPIGESNQVNKDGSKTISDNSNFNPTSLIKPVGDLALGIANIATNKAAQKKLDALEYPEYEPVRSTRLDTGVNKPIYNSARAKVGSGYTGIKNQILSGSDSEGQKTARIAALKTKELDALGDITSKEAADVGNIENLNVNAANKTNTYNSLGLNKQRIGEYQDDINKIDTKRGLGQSNINTVQSFIDNVAKGQYQDDQLAALAEGYGLPQILPNESPAAWAIRARSSFDKNVAKIFHQNI